MKKVFTNSEIVHEFNLQEQYEGRTSSGSMYFYGKKLYSYGSHYLLCEFLDNNTVMINNHGYSNTTAKHISLITSATRNRKQYFTYQTDTETVNKTIKGYLNKLVNARKKESINQYVYLIDTTFKMYLDFVSYKRQKTSKNKNPLHREILRLSNSFYNDFDNLEKTIKDNSKKQALKDKKAIVQKVKDWKANKIQWFNNNTKTDFLRLKGENIQTSQGVKISIKEAKRVLNILQNRNVKGEKIDNRFTIISFNNLLKVGCHNIPLKEINYIKNLI